MYNPRVLIKAWGKPPDPYHESVTFLPALPPSCPPQLREQPFAAPFASQMAWVLWIPELEGHTWHGTAPQLIPLTAFVTETRWGDQWISFHGTAVVGGRGRACEC